MLTQLNNASTLLHFKISALQAMHGYVRTLQYRNITIGHSKLLVFYRFTIGRKFQLDIPM